MPQIVVTAGDGKERRANLEVLRERVRSSDLESEVFVSHLVERIEWALADADTIEARAQRRPIAPRSGDQAGGSSSRSSSPTRSQPTAA